MCGAACGATGVSATVSASVAGSGAEVSDTLATATLAVVAAGSLFGDASCLVVVGEAAQGFDLVVGQLGATIVVGHQVADIGSCIAGAVDDLAVSYDTRTILLSSIRADVESIDTCGTRVSGSVTELVSCAVAVAWVFATMVTSVWVIEAKAVS